MCEVLVLSGQLSSTVQRSRFDFDVIHFESVQRVCLDNSTKNNSLQFSSLVV